MSDHSQNRPANRCPTTGLLASATLLSLHQWSWTDDSGLERARHPVSKRTRLNGHMLLSDEQP